MLGLDQVMRELKMSIDGDLYGQNTPTAETQRAQRRKDKKRKGMDWDLFPYGPNKIDSCWMKKDGCVTFRPNSTPKSKFFFPCSCSSPVVSRSIDTPRYNWRTIPTIHLHIKATFRCQKRFKYLEVWLFIGLA